MRDEGYEGDRLSFWIVAHWRAPRKHTFRGPIGWIPTEDEARNCCTRNYKLFGVFR